MATLVILLLLVALSSVLGRVTKDQNGVQSLISPDSTKNEINNNSKIDEQGKLTTYIWYSEETEGREYTTYFVEEKGHRMAFVTWRNINSESRDVTDCRLYGDKFTIDKILQDIPKDHILSVGKEEMKKLIEECTILYQSQEYNEVSQPIEKIYFSPGGKRSNPFRKLLIYPGTKWCGVGNVAEDFHDLGPSMAADSCCRAHDHCNDSLPSSASRYGLINNAPYLKSHCDCDIAFAKCLLNAGTRTANSIGVLYFNLLQVQCYKNDHPIVRCLKYIGFPYIHWSCQEYVLDKKRPLKWQFFDAKYYDAP